MPLPLFSPFPSPCSEDVNLRCQELKSASHISNRYVFSPFGPIGPVLRFLVPFKIPFTIIVPEFIPHPYWWPEWMARCEGKLCIAKQVESLPYSLHRVQVTYLFPVQLLCGKREYLVFGLEVSPKTFFLHFTLQSLPRVPKLFFPAVACP